MKALIVAEKSESFTKPLILFSSTKYYSQKQDNFANHNLSKQTIIIASSPILLSLFVHTKYNMNMDYSDIFAEIYRNRRWGRRGPASGEGSRRDAAVPFTHYLSGFLAGRPEVRKILDLGCGDLSQWPSEIFKNHLYTGIDLVPNVMKDQISQLKTLDSNLLPGNFLELNLPAADLVIIKDVLIHLPFSDFQRTINKLSEYQWILLVTDIFSHGFRVSLGKVKRSVSRGSLYGNLIQRLFQARDILTSDIAPGGYHWVDVNNFLDVLLLQELKIVSQITYKNSGYTLGRTTIKQITLLRKVR